MGASNATERELGVAEGIPANENMRTRRERGAFLGYFPPEANAKYRECLLNCSYLPEACFH